MVLKSPYDPDNQIYEHLVQSSDLAIPPKEFLVLNILPSLPVRHQNLRENCAAFTGASIAEYHFPSPSGQLLPKFIYYHQATPRRMYGRKVFQILQKKGIPTKEEFRSAIPSLLRQCPFGPMALNDLLNFQWVSKIGQGLANFLADEKNWLHIQE